MTREGPRIAQGASWGPPTPPRARAKKPKNPYLLQGPTERPRGLFGVSPFQQAHRSSIRCCSEAASASPVGLSQPRPAIVKVLPTPGRGPVAGFETAWAPNLELSPSYI